MSRVRAAGLFLAVVVGAALLARVAVESTASVVAAAVILAFLIVGLTARPAALTSALAALLPIWSVGSIDPTLFDLARYALVVAILFRVAPHADATRTRSVRIWGAWLAATGLGVATVSLARSDHAGLVVGYTTLLGAIAGVVVVNRLDDIQPFARGYLAGATLSAVVLILGAAGHPTITPNTNAGFFRASGLSASAVLVSVELSLAVACALWLFRGSRHRLVVALAGLTCLVAMMASGGRGGVAGLIVATLLATRWGYIRGRHFVALIMLAALGVWLTARQGVVFNTVDRFSNPGTGATFGTGRGLLLDDALYATVQHPLGMGLSQFRALYGQSPHVALLTFAVAGTALAGLVVTVMAVRLGSLSFAVRPSNLLAPLLVGNLVAWALLQPNGPFMGLEGAAWLLLAVREMQPTTATESVTSEDDQVVSCAHS